MPARHQRLKDVFFAACDLGPEERRGFLRRECAGDPDLEKEILGMLEEDARSEDALQPGGLEVPRLEPTDVGAALPQRIGAYEIVREVGQGGMGVVYEALQESPRRRVALKVIATRLGAEDLRKRFEHESQILGHLLHPGIAQIYEARTTRSSEGDQPYFVMEFVEGKPLTDYAVSEGLDTRQKLDLVARLCDAIHHAHQKGIVHRDLKPGNVLVTADGQPKILDFGIARATDPDLQMTVLRTSTGQLVGTLPYMSPEQASTGATDLDARSDIYSLGVILFELLSGRTPHDLADRSLYDALQCVRDEEPPRLGTMNRSLRGDVETIVGKALSKERERRYPSAAALAGDIRRYLRNEPILAHPPSAFYQIKKFAGRNKLLVSGVAALFLVLLAGVSVSTYLAFEARTEATTANTVVDLFRSMFRSASPDAVKGPDYTVRELLDEFSDGLREQLSGEPLVEATLRATIALAYQDLGEFDKAQAQHEKAIELFKQEVGVEDSRTLSAMNGLGNVLRGKAQYSAAERVHKEVLELKRRTQGGDNINTLTTMNNIAAVLLDQGRVAEAEEMLQEILEIQERLQIGGELFTLPIERNLAGACFYQGRLDEAERLYLKTLEHSRLRRELEHPDYVADVANLGFVYLQQGRLTEAEPLFREALATQRRILVKGHRATLLSIQGLGDVYYKLKRYSDAAPLLREWCETPGAHRSDPVFYRYKLWLGRCLIHLPELAGAEAVLEEGFAAMARRDGPGAPGTAAFRKELQGLYRSTDRAELATSLEPLPPRTPRAVKPGAMAVESLTPSLGASAFDHELPAVEHALSHWQIRRDDASYHLDPAYEVASRERLAELPLPAGLLLPGTRYLWRVRFTGSNHVASSFSVESAFATPSLPRKIVHVDLESVFNRDVIADPGDETQDFFDGDAGSVLTVEGFDGRRADNPAVRGIPRNGRVGVHRLGEFQGANSLELTRASAGAVRLPLPAGRFHALRLLVAGGNGDSRVPLTLEYEDRLVEERVLLCPDWFEDRPPPGEDVFAVWNGMDRLVNGSLDDVDDPALFEALLPISPQKELRGILLDGARATFESDRTRFHLFAVTAVGEP